MGSFQPYKPTRNGGNQQNNFVTLVRKPPDLHYKVIYGPEPIPIITSLATSEKVSRLVETCTVDDGQIYMLEVQSHSQVPTSV